jgi:deazaflavin-dependent oxidoreductase (nitroreductase family)
LQIVPENRAYQAPSWFEITVNRLLGKIAGWGLGPAYVYLLQVRGRKTGKLYSTPVSLLELDGKMFLVAPRGRTQWVRNAEVAGEITLKRGATRRFRLRQLADLEKPQVLKAYLANYKKAVQRFFPLKAEAPLSDFAQIAAGYPAFELTA